MSCLTFQKLTFLSYMLNISSHLTENTLSPREKYFVTFFNRCYLLWESKMHTVTEMQNFLKLEHLVHDSTTGLQMFKKK